ncbi:MAG: hypothetical protein QF415_06280 [Candidatus Undinarchaeales archaeon]|jgi:hypothetical protein|nr:hypothetical protein [Candidatus Undinarchaeales archaeon]MDP7492033.1 hypothetical protein [Candidatus Undinarchaeales archaeon]
MDSEITGKLISMLLVGLVIGVAIGQQSNSTELERCRAVQIEPTTTTLGDEVVIRPVGTSDNFTVESSETVAVPTP